eukprot:scaffold11232_cov100-Isochrysis_galbana.AAC.3
MVVAPGATGARGKARYGVYKWSSPESRLEPRPKRSRVASAHTPLCPYPLLPSLPHPLRIAPPSICSIPTTSPAAASAPPPAGQPIPIPAGGEPVLVHSGG